MGRPKICKRIFGEPKIICFKPDVKVDYQKSQSERRQIISISNEILHDSKKTIFALHRGEIKQAEGNFAAIEASLLKMEKNFGFNRNEDEGSYKAAVEEYVEAKMFYFYLAGKKIARTRLRACNIQAPYPA